MNTSRLCNVKTQVLTLFLLVILSTTSMSTLFTFFSPVVVAQSFVKVSLDPTLVSANPGANFTIDINIENVTSPALYSWSLKIKWGTGLLTGLDAQEGPFLKGGGSTVFTWSAYTSYVDLACVTLGAGSASGSGTLANVTFNVKDTGNCTLNLYDVTLLDPSLAFIEDWDAKDSPDDSYFYTSFPKAKPIAGSPYNNYFYTPNAYQPGHPIAGETLTFNGSACYDPDDSYEGSPGGIVSYRWKFGDGNTTTTANPTITHTYAASGTCTGNLTITDDDGETDIEIFTVEVKLHDLALINVTVTPTEVKVGETAAINVTVLNEGSEAEYLNVTVYYDSTPIRTKLFQYIWRDQWGNPNLRTSLPNGENHTMTWGTTSTFQHLVWNTTGVTPGVHTISAEAFLVDQANISRELTGIELDLADNTFIDGALNVTDVSVHDIAITSVDVPAKASINSLVDIRVTVLNEGNTGANFNMSVYYDSQFIENRTNVILAAGLSQVLSVTWNTTGIALGNYTIRAEVSPLPGETDIVDNMREANVTLLQGPVASFTYSPSTSLMTKETITFDATASYDVDGEVVSYEWDFGDDTTKIYVGANLTAIATHVYAAPRTPGTKVTLTVTDNDGLVAEHEKSLPRIYPARDVAIINITLSSNTILIGENLTITVTVENLGDAVEKSDVTAYYDSTKIETTADSSISVGAEAEFTLSWNTTDADPGIYTIKAVVASVPASPGAHSTREINTTNNELSIGPLTLRAYSTISVFVHPADVAIGDSTTINGTISPVRTDANVTIDYRASGEASWNTIATVKTDDTGSYEFLWTPATLGSYELRASWPGDEITLAASSTTTLTVSKISSTISLDVSETSIPVGSTITMSGAITPARSQVNVAILYRPSGGDWSTLATVTTDTAGQYSWDWATQDAGTYEVKASWAGDEDTMADESDIITVNVQQPFPLTIIVVAGVGVAAVAAGAAFYFLRIRKPKP